MLRNKLGKYLFMHWQRLIAVQRGTAVLLLLACAPFINAQEVADRYQIEIIVFKQADAPSAVAQLKGVSRPEVARYLNQAAVDLSQTTGGDAIHAVAKNQLLLTGEARKIEQAWQYELLYHGAWRQPPYHRAQARYINILKEPRGGLIRGIGWLSYERYFKLLLDFQYDPNFAQTTEVVDTPEAFSIPIHLERVMEAEKLFYLDHPIIGVVAIINPL